MTILSSHLGPSGWCRRTSCCSRRPVSLARPRTRTQAGHPHQPQSPGQVVISGLKELFDKILPTLVYVTYPSIFCHLGKLESSNCVAHLAVDSVHTKVAVGRIRLPMLRGWSVLVSQVIMIAKEHTGEGKRWEIKYLSSDKSLQRTKDTPSGWKPWPDMAGGEGAAPKIKRYNTAVQEPQIAFEKEKILGYLVPWPCLKATLAPQHE